MHTVFLEISKLPAPPGPGGGARPPHTLGGASLGSTPKSLDWQTIAFLDNPRACKQKGNWALVSNLGNLGLGSNGVWGFIFNDNLFQKDHTYIIIHFALVGGGCHFPNA